MEVQHLRYYVQVWDPPHASRPCHSIHVTFREVQSTVKRRLSKLIGTKSGSENQFFG